MNAYDANLFLHDIARDAELRDLARADPRAALMRYRIPAEQQDLFLRGEVGLLFRMGVNDFLLHNVPRFGLFGVDVPTYSDRIRAEAPRDPTDHSLS